MRNLLALPAELLSSILSYLNPPDLLSCTEVARRLHRLISDSSRLQYSISLAKHRLLDILQTSSNPPYATRLRILRDRERAWRELAWKSRHTLHLPPTGSVYEFVGGIYGNGREDENRVTASISFLELPSSDPMHLGLPSQNLRTWTHAMGDVAIIDFTMDPSQNLLVLVALASADSKFIYDLHLRTISTNEPHPKAPLPILSCLERHPPIPPPLEVFAAVRVQVSGDLVGLLIKEAPESIGAHLEIWNWENDPHYSCSLSDVHGIDDFTFLSHSSFLVVLPTGKFEVYTFPDPLPPTSSKSFSRACEPVRRYTYNFPELSDGYLYWYISMSCNPAPGYIPSHGGRGLSPFPPSPPHPPASKLAQKMDRGNESFSSGSDKDAKQLYYPLPDERIHACCIYIFNPNHHNNANAIINGAGDDLDDENQQVHSFVFFLNLKTLLEPPDEWFRLRGKCDAKAKAQSQQYSPSTSTTLTSKLGPLWTSPSSEPAIAPATGLGAQESMEIDETNSASKGLAVGSLPVDISIREPGNMADSTSLDFVQVLDTGSTLTPKVSASTHVDAASPSTTPLPFSSPAYSGSSPASPTHPSTNIASSTYPPFPTFLSPYSATNGNNNNSYGRNNCAGNSSAHGSATPGAGPSTSTPTIPLSSTSIPIDPPTSPTSRTHLFMSSATRSAFSPSTSPSTSSVSSSSSSASAAAAVVSRSTTITKPRSLAQVNEHAPVPWEVWGPPSTRWFEECLSTDWQHAIYGLRTVESVSVKERERKVAHVGAKTLERVQKGKDKAYNETDGERVTSEEANSQGRARVKKEGKERKRKANVGVQTDLNQSPENTRDPEMTGQGEETGFGPGSVELDAEEGEDHNGQQRPLGFNESPATKVNGVTSNNSESDDGQPSPSTSTSYGTSLNGAHQAETQTGGEASSSTQPTRRRPRRFLRVRDFNPYSLRLAEGETEEHKCAGNDDTRDGDFTSTKSKGKQRAVPPSLYPYPTHPIRGPSTLNDPAPSPRFVSKSPKTNVAPNIVNGKSVKQPTTWNKKRVVREPSIIPVKGVFKNDIVSRLPYTEVVSEEAFEVTDVMMDDCRLLLLKRGQMGKLESVDVLMM